MGIRTLPILYHGKLIKLLTDHHGLEPLIKQNRTNKTHSARLTSCMDQLAHFTITVNHITGKHLPLTDSLSRNPSVQPQTDEAYDEEYVIENILPHYKFIHNYGCLSNHIKQSESEQDENERKTKNEPLPQDARKQTANDCLIDTTFTRNLSKPQATKSTNLTMVARTIENLAAVDSSEETTELIQ